MIGPDRSLREVFGSELCELARRNPRLVVLDGDLANSTHADRVVDCAPSQFLEMGIAEQNMVGVAAGLASLGFRPWVSSFATFLSKRALDQVKVVVVQTRLPVVLVGGYAGLLNGRNGKTHQALFDLTIMRSLPGMRVVAPCDADELRGAMRWLSAIDGPAYLRLTRDSSPVIRRRHGDFRPGLPVLLAERDHPHVAMVSTGVQSIRTVEAAHILEHGGIRARVVHLPTLEPLETPALLDVLSDAPIIITVEDHSRVGGLGSLVCEVVAESAPRKVVRIGLDGYGESASNDDLMEAFGLGPHQIAERARDVLRGT